MVRVIASRTASAPWPASAGPFFDARRVTVARKAGKMQQHREAGCALDQCADRRAAKAQDEVSFPVPWHRPIGRFGRTLADHDLGRDKTLAAPADARPRHPQHPPCSQAGREFAAQRSFALDEEGLIDGFVADAHGLVVREVDRQAPGNLFRAPGPGPSPILSLAMPAALPGDGRTGNGNTARSDDDASQSLLHISAQGRVEGKLRRLRATGRSLGMPLGGRRAILQPTAAGGCVAPQLTGDRRGGSTEPAPDLLHGMALDPQKRNLLTLQQRQVPPGERLCRGSEHRWGHAACLSEPSGSYRLRHTGLDRSILAAHSQLRSLTRTGSVHRVPPQVADPVTVTALVQTDPTAAFECSSQPPLPGCCDDRLNPP